MTLKRTLEPEIMADMDEAKAYDKLVSATQGDILDTCFALSVLDTAPPEGVILDLGAGTGRIPLKIARFSSRYSIHAVDMSRSMLQLAAESIESEDPHPNIHCIQADGKTLPYPDASVDMVISHVALHHLSNPVDMLKEARRILKPDGAFLFRDLKRPSNRITLELYVQIFGGGYDPIQKKLYRDSLKAGFSLTEFQKMATDAGLEGFEVKQYFITHVGIEKKSVHAKPGPRRGLPGLKGALMQHFYRRCGKLRGMT